MFLSRVSTSLSKWSNPTASIGRRILTTRIIARSVWFAQGPALEAFEADIQPAIDRLLNNLDLGQADIFIRLYMIGRKEDDANPIVMVCCANPKVRDEAHHGIRSSGLLDSHPGFGLGASGRLLESSVRPRKTASSGSSEDDLAGDADCQSTTPADELSIGIKANQPANPGQNTPGCPLEIFSEETAPVIGRRLFLKDESGDDAPRCSTGGVVICCTGEYYQLTVRHVWDRENYESDDDAAQSGEYDDLDECYFDGQSDEQGEEQVDVEFEMMSRASRTPEDSCSSVASAESELSVTSDSSRLAQTPEDLATPYSPQRDSPAVSFTSGILQVVGQLGPQSNHTSTVGLDYSLIRLDPVVVQKHRHYVNTIPETSFDGVIRVAQIGSDERNILAVTASAGKVRGVIVPGAISYRQDCHAAVQKLFLVQLDGIVIEGDSGSAVVDEVSGDLYGHLVLGEPGTRNAYIVPATDLFDDIQRELGAEARLLNRPSVVAEEMLFCQERLHGISLGESEVATYTRGRQDQSRLRHFDVICLTVNKMIGTGIFTSPDIISLNIWKSSPSLLLWFASIIFCAARPSLDIEHGPGASDDAADKGIRMSIPQSGGELIYLEYASRQPMLFLSCLCGLIFIVVGNMAGNSINCANLVVEAAGVPSPSISTVRAIAIAAATLSIMVHFFSRRHAIWINKLFAIVKVGVLVLMILLGIIHAGSYGSRHSPTLPVEPPDHPTRSSSSWLRAILPTESKTSTLAVILTMFFAWVGVEHVDILPFETSRAHRRYHRSLFVGTGVAVLCSIAILLSFGAIVEMDNTQVPSKNTVELLLSKILMGRTGFKKVVATGVSIALPLWSFGNMIVMTFTVARIKREIAKEGILPWPLFTTILRNAPVERLTDRSSVNARSSGRWPHLLPKASDGILNDSIALQLAVWFAIFFATYGLEPAEAYTFIVGVTSYAVNFALVSMLVIGIFVQITFRRRVSEWNLPGSIWRRVVNVPVLGVLLVLVASWYRLKIKVALGSRKSFPFLDTCILAVSMIYHSLSMISRYMRGKYVKSQPILQVYRLLGVERRRGEEGDDEKEDDVIQMHELVYQALAVDKAHLPTNPDETGSH